MIERLSNGNLPSRLSSTTSARGGGILFCNAGSAIIHHNFRSWSISRGTVMTFFPNDIIRIESCSDDFMADVLHYSAEILRSASMQMEDVVYEWLRNDCCNTSEKVSEITKAMFTIIELYAGDISGDAFDRILTLQLKSYFTGLFEQVKSTRPSELLFLRQRNRITEQFNYFMHLLELHYKTGHDVAFFASKMSITPKHLASVTKRVTDKSPKELIDEYLIIHIKLALSETTMSVKEIAWEFNFSTFSFFCSFFTRRTGVSPTRYRNAMRHA